ncbi:MAG: bifunctional DNA-formamidopyrimidine glycosylase/DNA-(apurinic or apyrimidinic site) lyase, partial [Candidatus Dormibacteraeota bacterium]|nr:bifunctional DNA-formamidopyrimidine glycosylase/DNA-(apurinic or apyrimidinic site) lyase [Candidatus Dormibacteraeota bacterium]
RYSVTHLRVRSFRCSAALRDLDAHVGDPSTYSSDTALALPELPEVETIVSDLRPLLLGRRIEAVDVRFPTIVRHPEPEVFERDLPGEVVSSVNRRGKYILIGLEGGSGGEEQRLLVVHLGMTGQLLHKLPDQVRRPHTHVVLALDNGTELRYSDPRRFGRLLLGTERDLVAARKLPKLGPEPLDSNFTSSDLRRRLRGRRAPLKMLLLDQSLLAGVGNIYADEACFTAGIRPDRPPTRISALRVRRLHAALRESLLMGLANRGSSIDDYVDLYGAKGRQQEELRVYGRGGRPCVGCGRVLTLIRLGGRATVFCRKCQR